MSDIKNSNSIIAKKSYVFSLAIITNYKHLTNSKKEYVLSKQLLRSGTSIGSNVNEALSAESKKDFIHKLGIILKELRETSICLKIMQRKSLLWDVSILDENKELIAIFSKSVVTAKANASS